MKEEVRKQFAEQAIIICREHRKKCKKQTCTINTAFVGIVLHDKELITQEEFVRLIKDGY